MALSTSPVRDLFSTEFGEGSMRATFGNLLWQLERMTGSFADTVELASTKFLRRQWPSLSGTLDDTTMSIKLKDGTVVDGQHAADRPKDSARRAAVARQAASYD